MDLPTYVVVATDGRGVFGPFEGRAQAELARDMLMDLHQSSLVYAIHPLRSFQSEAASVLREMTEGVNAAYEALQKESA